MKAGAWGFGSLGEPVETAVESVDHYNVSGSCNARWLTVVREVEREQEPEYLTSAGRDIALCREVGVKPWGEL